MRPPRPPASPPERLIAATPKSYVDRIGQRIAVLMLDRPAAPNALRDVLVEHPMTQSPTKGALPLAQHWAASSGPALEPYPLDPFSLHAHFHTTIPGMRTLAECVPY